MVVVSCLSVGVQSCKIGQQTNQSGHYDLSMSKSKQQPCFFVDSH